MELKKPETLPDRIYLTIHGLIQKEEYPVGDKLPSEQELAKQLRVSRTALREALQRLELDGYIDRRHGIGTFVISASPKMNAGLEKLESMTDFIKWHGLTPGTINAMVIRGHAAAPITDLLQLEPETPIITFERVRTADKLPFAYDIVVAPEAIIGDDDREVQQQESFFAYLEQQQNQQLIYSNCTIFADKATPELADKLRIEPGEALQVLEQVHYTKGNKPLYYGKSYIRNDVLKFHFIRRR